MQFAVRGSVLLSVAASLAMAVLPAQAQPTETNVGIVAISAGGIFGLGGHGSYGASLEDPVAKHWMPDIDFSYSPLTSYGYSYGLNDTGKGLFTSSMLDLNGGVKFRFAGKRNWAPYIGVGAGLLRFSTTNATSGFGTTATVNASRTEFAGNFSVGGLYYVTDHLGFLMEAKGYVAQRNQFGRVSLGLFFQFP
jgi:hypothetical protein